MSVFSLGTQHLTMRSAEDVHDVFQRLGYDVYDPEPFEGDDLDQLDLDDADRQAVNRAYVVAQRDSHTVYLYEVSDLRQIRLRGLAWHALQRGTALLAVTRDYREILFVDPRFVGKPNKSSVRVNKLKLVSSDPTRHDLDTLNAIHAHRRTGQQVYDAQAEAFNVTTITKKFYEEYRRHYEHARATIRQYNPGVREFQNNDQSDKLHAFTQRLLGRLMFLYFLQRKGWLGERQKFLTEKYMETMRQHAHELHGDGETFHYYREVLEPLFFQTMNTQRPDDITQWQGIRIPYLNGGLFDESRDPAGPIIIPDALFDPNSNAGLLAFFNRYNFTIEDDTPLEQDVSVDPEMLGKVFENMLEERDRGQSGSFYTPRTIVAYMCQEALAGYLEESANAPRETTRAQFDPDSEVRYTPEEAEPVNAALNTLTVLDPAVGSGSFLIGMMSEIIRLRKACYAALQEGQEVPAAMLADWKEAIIRDTLYGVDIKPEAIEIAQLRLWLALVVDQTLEQARPLPNLDYKLMAGNSLIETIDGEPVLGESAQAMMGADVTPAQPTLGLFETDKERFKLDELRAKFFRATPEERRKLREDITAQERRIVATSLREKVEPQMQIINQMGRISAQTNGKLKASDERKLKTAVNKLERLTRLQEDMGKPDYALPFFLYKLHFSEVFDLEKGKGGFDIVVANPPYVRMELFKEQKEELQATYTDVYAGRADLFVYFIARGYGLLKPHGQFAYITSNKWLRAKYGEGLRDYLSQNVTLNMLMDFGDLPIFDAAAYPCILLGSKFATINNIVHSMAVTDVEALENLHMAAKTAGKVKQSNFNREAWQIIGSDVGRVIAQLTSDNEKLSAYTDGKFYMGVKSGLNDAFVIDGPTRERLVDEDMHSSEIIKPFLIGRDVKRWTITNQRRYLLFMYRGVDITAYPAVKRYLEPFRERLTARATSANHEWYELQQPQMGIYPEFDKAKIVYPEFGIQPQFAYDNEALYLNNKLFTIPTDDFFLLGVLNSDAVHIFLRVTGSQIRGGYIEFRWMTLANIPIPNASDDLRQKIAALARRCLDAAKSAPESLPALEAELNALVYQAYGLDMDDIAVIEGYLSNKSTASIQTDASEFNGDDDGS
ncbi:MAG: Eco57I restriction-modification methylase domain-containing protein [Anaerolineae bacterium]|nr:Eco57I restriction-modification methylase domain-containing protein [Anaerolineae bacterium]